MRISTGSRTYLFKIKPTAIPIWFIVSNLFFQICITVLVIFLYSFELCYWETKWDLKSFCNVALYKQNSTTKGNQSSNLTRAMIIAFYKGYSLTYYIVLINVVIGLGLGNFSFF